VLKLFPDILLFYGFIYIITFIAILAKLFRPLYTFFHWKINIGSWTISVGETLLSLLFCGVLTAEGFYWMLDHTWDSTGKLNSSRSKYELLARSAGQLANFVMGLLVLPTTRNSIWTTIFDVSFENMLIYHIYLGYLFLLLVVLHGVFWSIIYIKAGTLSKNIFAIPAQDMYADDFTVPLAEITSVVMIVVMGCISFYKIRRANYDLFYFTHHFFIVIFLVVLWHATMSWYYILAGLSLWGVDHIVRFLRPIIHSATVSSVSVVGDNNIAKIEFVISSSLINPNNGPINHEAGQYVYINIPDISQVAWHPFTISSAPFESASTIHVKSMKEDEWTGRLVTLIKSGECKSLHMNVDGPYGVTLSTLKYKAYLLIGGGIGITPLISYYKELIYYATSNNNNLRLEYAHIKKVELVWIVKTSADANAFKDVLEDLHKDIVEKGLHKVGGGAHISYTIFITRSPPPHGNNTRVSNNSNSNRKVAMMTSADSKIIYSRPDLSYKIKELSFRGMEAIVFSCGPQSLQDDCNAHARGAHIDYKSESFEM